VPETKKVTDFLAGIADPRLATAKDLFLGDTAKLGDFEACQQYLKTLVYNKATQDKHERSISGLQAGNPKGGGKCQDGKRKRGGNDKSNTNDVTTRSYTRDEWQKLSPEQRDNIRALRAARRDKIVDKSTGRNASSLTLQDGENANQDTEASVETQDTAASRQNQPTNGSNGRR
jgi:hypothetical protein